MDGFWIVLAGITGVIAAALAAVTVIQGRRRKRLLVYGLESIQLLSANPDTLDLVVQHRGRQLADPYLFALNVESRSHQGISTDSFDDGAPMRFEIDRPAYVIPSNAAEQISFSSEDHNPPDGTTRAEIPPQLVHPGAKGSFVALTDGQPRVTLSQKPFVDVTVATEEELIESSWPRVMWDRHGLGISVGLGIAILIGLVAIPLTMIISDSIQRADARAAGPHIVLNSLRWLDATGKFEAFGDLRDPAEKGDRVWIFSARSDGQGAIASQGSCWLQDDAAGERKLFRCVGWAGVDGEAGLPFDIVASHVSGAQAAQLEALGRATLPNISDIPTIDGPDGIATIAETRP